MDPNETLRALMNGYDDQDCEAIEEAAIALRDWIDAGGFPPSGTTRAQARGIATGALHMIELVARAFAVAGTIGPDDFAEHELN